MQKTWFLAILPVSVLLLAQTPAPAPVRGGNLVVALNAEPPMLDPTQSTSQEIARMLYLNVLEGLVGFDVRGKIVPVLATGLPQISDGGLTYTFKLKPNVTFHDGSSFNSADVKAKFDRARTKGSGHTNTAYFENIKDIQSPDPATVVFHLTKVDAEFLFNLARPDGVIGPSGNAAAIEAQKTKPIGTGPFKFDIWNRGANVRLVRNPNYHVSSLPYLESVVFRFMGADTSTQVAALRAGDIDVIGYSLSAEQANTLKSDSRFRVIVGNSTAEVTIGLNNAKKPFNDLRVRRAFNYAIDKREIINGAFFGFGKPIWSHHSEGERYHINLNNYYPYDPARAKMLLAQAGYPNGLSVKFTVTAEYPIERRTAEVYAAQLARIGVNAQIEIIPFSSWIQKVFLGKDYEMTIIGHAEPFDLNIYADPNYYFGYNSKKFQDLNTQAISTTDETARARIYGQMQLLLAQDAVNVWAFTAPYLAATRANVYGWWTNQPTPVMNVVRVFKTR